jgi:hypothetical protein
MKKLSQRNQDSGFNFDSYWNLSGLNSYEILTRSDDYLVKKSSFLINKQQRRVIKRPRRLNKKN